MLSCEFCGISKNTFSREHLETNASARLVFSLLTLLSLFPLRSFKLLYCQSKIFQNFLYQIKFVFRVKQLVSNFFIENLTVIINLEYWRLTLTAYKKGLHQRNTRLTYKILDVYSCKCLINIF